VADPGEILLLGNAGAGKTTLLTQLYGRLQAGSGQLRMRSAPASIAPIRAAMQRLEQGLPVEHTPNTTNVEQVLHAFDGAGRPVDIVLPDYAGESLTDVVTSRRVPPLWQQRIRRTEHWVLLLRLAQHSSLPDVISRPVANPQSDGAAVHPDGGAALPLDLWAVELLQILLHTRRTDPIRRPPPRLTVALSCWDELGKSGTAGTPDQQLRKRTALVADFVVAHWTGRPPAVVGLSAQGQALSKDDEAANFVDQGPQQMGWLVLPDGTRDPDLTRLLTDL
jgi:hypothetical protein